MTSHKTTPRTCKQCRTTFAARLDHIKHGYGLFCSRSCSLKFRCDTGQVDRKNIKHGHHTNDTPSPTYKSWRAMLKRCTQPTAKDYPRYGAKGITVCERWSEFENFLKDMGERPADHSIDRIDPKKNYTPDNCRWLPLNKQSANREFAYQITIKNKTMSLTEWLTVYPITRNIFYARIKKGWSEHDALTKPRQRGRQ